MTRFSGLPIRTQLLTLAILLTLPALGIIVYSGFKERAEDYRHATVESQNLAENLTGSLEQLIHEAQTLGSLLAELPEVKNRNVEKVQPLLSKIQKKTPQYQNILIADATGEVWVSSTKLTATHSVADRRYFHSARATLQFSSGEFVLSKVLQKPTISVAYPLINTNNNFAGVVILSFDLDILRSILERSKLPQDTNYVVADNRGIIISRGKDPGVVVGKPLKAGALKQMEEGPERATFEFVRIDGDKRITTYSKLRLPGEQKPYLYVRAGISTKFAVARANRQLLHNLAMLTPFVFVAFALALIIGKRSIADRVSHLQNAAQQIADGDLRTRVAHLVEGGELGELGRAFDDMTRRLAENITEHQRSEEEIKRLNGELEQRVALRTEELELSIREQEAFNYTVSHDLRAPLRHINSFSAILLEEYGADIPPQGQQYLSRIRAASNRMGLLIDDLLQLARVSRLAVRRETVNLSTMATEIAAMLQDTDADRRVEFIIADGLNVKGDRTLLRMVMQNLLDNAWKYTGKVPAARIEFGTCEMAEGRTFFVRDNGAGFDMQYLHKLFGPFQRLHGDEYEGTGIGLATVQRIIHRHNGKVWAEGRLNEGATFYFYLPQQP